MICIKPITSDQQSRLEDIFNIGMIEEVQDWQVLVDFALKQKELDNAHCILCSFDDYYQSCYTSMHASQDERLYPPDLNGDLEEPQVYHEEFKYRLQVLTAYNLGDFKSLMGKINLSEDDINILIQVNANPMAVCDLPIKVSKVPVIDSADLLMAFPNGYFS